MVKKSVVSVFAAALVALSMAGCAQTASSDQGASLDSKGEASGMMTGAYGGQRALTDADKALFDTVMKDCAKDKTYELVSVATQVVSGTNYKFLAKVTEAGKESQVYVVIYQPLPNSGKAASFVKETPVE